MAKVRHRLYCVVLSCSVVSDSLRPHGLYSPWNSLGQNTGVGSLSLLQGIFPTWGSNLGLLNCRWILYHLSLHAQLCPTVCEPMGSSLPDSSFHVYVNPISFTPVYIFLKFSLLSFKLTMFSYLGYYYIILTVSITVLSSHFPFLNSFSI